MDGLVRLSRPYQGNVKAGCQVAMLLAPNGPDGEARLYPLHVTTTERAKPLPGDRRTPAK